MEHEQREIRAMAVNEPGMPKAHLRCHVSLYDVHAKSLKKRCTRVEVADTDHPGHPLVQILQQENPFFGRL